MQVPPPLTPWVRLKLVVGQHSAATRVRSSLSVVTPRMVSAYSLPDPYIVMLTGFSLLTALVVWLPLALRKLPLSLPIVCIGLGAAIFSLPQVTLKPLPLLYPDIAERFTEFVVIIALMGAGLKIDRVFGWRRWAVT